MINVRQNGDVYEIIFRYNQNIIAHIKNIPGRRWIPDRKLWTIPSDRLGWLLNELKGTAYEKSLYIQSEEDLNVNATLDSTQAIPEIDISKIPFYVKEGATPYKHQLDFMKYAIDRQQRGIMSGFLLADDQGLAKTNECMNLALYNKKQHGFKHCLVICCINSSKFNWKKDIEDHTRGKESPYILGTRLKRDKISTRSNTGGKEKLEDLQTGHMYGDKHQPKLPYFIIVNIEALRYKSGKSYAVADEIINWINSDKIQMIAIDEIHKNASPSSMQGKQILRIKRATGSKVLWLPMTGTPITNKPTDVFLPLKLTDSHTFSSYYTWCKEFCVYGGFGGHEIMGYKNIPRMKAMLQNNMLRRLKSEVLDLPPKIRYTEYVENTPYQSKLYDDISAEICSSRNDILDSLNPLTKLLRLRQVNGNPELVDSSLKLDSDYVNRNAKLQKLLELLEEISERGEKVIVFSNWVESLRTLYRFISKKYKTCCFTGTMSPEDREKHKHVFLTNPAYTVMLGTIGAMGTSQTFTVARNVIFYDEPWTPSDKEQAEDRCLVEGTKITTPNGFIPIEDLKVGDMVFTPDGNVKPITDCWNHTETTELVEIRFYGDPEPILMTADHKVLTVNGWKPAGVLRSAADDILCEDQTRMMVPATDDEVIVSEIPTGFDYERDLYFYNNHGVRQKNGRKHPIPEKIKLTDDFLFFCGYYLGDGCACHPGSNGGQIQLAGNTVTKMDSLLRCKKWFESNIAGATNLREEERHACILYLSNKCFNDFMANEFGRMHEEKKFPDWVYKLNKSQLTSLYEGLCKSDGYYDTRNAGTTQQWYTTVTPALASGVWWIISRLGYRGRIELANQSKYHATSKDAYNISHTINNNYRLKAGRIRNIARYTKEVKLYDITVADDESFYAWGTPLHNCYRIGTTQSVNIYTIMTQDTVDDRVHEILYTKRGISQYIVDGKLDLRKNPQLFDLLLGDTRKQ